MKKENMKKSDFVFLLSLLITSLLFAIKVSPVSAIGSNEEPWISAEAAVLIDGTTGHILYSLNADRKMHPASTTKILTALLGLELGNKKEVVHVSLNAAYKEGTVLFLNPGDTFYLFDLIKGALINSGNDAATAIAEHLGEKEDSFSSLMTHKAKTLGAFKSNFCNPHGLTDWKHMATAYDLALIARYALQNEDFRKIVGTKETTIFEIGSDKPIPLNNTNRLLDTSEFPVIGVKTGTTRAAGECLIAAAEKNGRLLISVVLNSWDRYGDTLRLLEYGFNRCVWYPVSSQNPFKIPVFFNGQERWVAIGAKKEIEVAIRKDEISSVEKRYVFYQNFRTTPSKGKEIGRIEVYLGEHLLYNYPLIAIGTTAERQKSRIGGCDVQQDSSEERRKSGY